MIWQNSHLRFTDALTFIVSLPLRPASGPSFFLVRRGPSFFRSALGPSPCDPPPVVFSAPPPDRCLLSFFPRRAAAARTRSAAVPTRQKMRNHPLPESLRDRIVTPYKLSLPWSHGRAGPVRAVELCAVPEKHCSSACFPIRYHLGEPFSSARRFFLGFFLKMRGAVLKKSTWQVTL